MKKREVVLDFTSLLDVTLIIIFFFVLFSHLDSEDNKIKTQSKIRELETAIQATKQKEATAHALTEQLSGELEILRASSERLAAHTEEILAYHKGANIKIILDMQEDSWSLRVSCKKEIISNISSHSNIEEELLQAIQMAGYQSADTIFCDVVFDGSLPGTALAYRTLTKSLNEVRKEYRFFYYSETDLSMGK